MADAQGVSRRRTYCVGIVAEQGAHAARAHVIGHARAGGLRRETPAAGRAAVATRFMCAILRPLVDDDDAPITVKSLATTATSRPSMRPKPAILPSAGVRSRSSRRELDVANRPDSMNVPGIEQLVDPLARIEHALGPAPRQPLGAAHGERRRAPPIELARERGVRLLRRRCRHRPSDLRVSPSMRPCFLVAAAQLAVPAHAITPERSSPEISSLP